MNLISKKILEDFRMCRSNYVRLGEIVEEKLNDIAKRSGAFIMTIEQRVKTEKSLAGKLERKNDSYQSLSELTDLLGARVICFFEDQLDVICKMVEQELVIDWANSADKRKQIGVKTFGYLSVHYIASLPSGAGYPEELCGLKFEIQLRTNLQHTWAQIEHDLGYKNEFGVPRVVARNFSRIAGMLELIDEEFVRTRNLMEQYTEDVRRKIIDGVADDVHIDSVSLAEFVKRGKAMQEFLRELSETNHAEIDEVNPLPYIEQLAWFGITTLGGLQDMMKDYGEKAMQLANNTLALTDLDILSSNIGLHYLCRAKLIMEDYTEEQIADFLKISTNDAERAKRQAKSLYASKKK